MFKGIAYSCPWVSTGQAHRRGEMILAWMFVGVGCLALGMAAFPQPWYLRHSLVRVYTKFLGPTGSRIMLAALGVLGVAVGAAVVLGWIPPSVFGSGR
jgi:hypothetical protein